MRTRWTAMLPSPAPREGLCRSAPFVCGNEPMADLDPSTDVILAEVAAAPSPEALEELRVRVLGRRGSLTLAMRELGGIEPEERRRAGAELNAAKDRITEALGEAAARLGRAALEQRLAGERADPTLPVPF